MILRYALPLLSLLCFGYSTALGQLVSNNAFLQGNYLEIGMAQCGVFGSTVTAPSGYHTQGSSYLGFVADVDKDGWTNGTPNFIGDYFRPGSPEEGFAIEINGTNYGNFRICGDNQISGSFTSVNNSGATLSADWSGSINGLAIDQTTELDTNTVFFSTTVTLTNTTTSTMQNVYYMRNVDPDNEQPLTGSWLTNNTIVHQNPNSQDLALVSATALTYGSVVALGAKDPRARVSHGGFTNRSASAVYNATGSLNGSGTATAVDQAISIAFDLGDLSPGESTCLTFFYMFDTTEYSTALASTSFECINLSVTSSPINLCQEDSFYVGYYLDTANVSPNSTNVFNVELSDSTGSFQSATVIGSYASTSPEDSIACYIPASVSFGSNYRLRVVMTDPSEIGADNGTDITIGIPQALFPSSVTSCSGSPAVLTVEPGAEFYVWSNGNTTNSISPTTTGTYSVTVLNGSCVDTFSTYVTAYVSPLLFLNDSVQDCNADSVELTSGIGYSSYAWSSGDTTSNTVVYDNGYHYLTVSNVFGCTATDSTHVGILDARITASADTVCSSESVLLQTNLYSDCLYFIDLDDENYVSDDIASFISDDYGSIAVTEDYIYYTGDLATVRMDADDFGNKVQYLRRDGIFSDLETGQLYTFWNPNFNDFYANQVTAIRKMNENLTYQNVIFLDQTISNSSWGNGVFAGEGFVILYSNYTDKFYHIDVIDGSVTDLGGTTSGFNSLLYLDEAWASYGVAECNDDGYAVIYRHNASNSIRRYNIATNTHSTVTTFGSSIGDLSNFTYSPWNQNWYFHIEGGSSLFGFGAEMISRSGVSLGSEDYTYTWSTGDSTNSIWVNPNSTQQYTVTISGNGQSCSDSVTINVKGTPIGSPFDTIVSCDTGAITVDAGGGFSSYLWSSGESTQQISSNAAYNRYRVTVTDSLACSSVKEIVAINASEMYSVPGDSICANDSFSLIPKNISTCNDITLTNQGSTSVEMSSIFSFDAAGLVATKDYVYYNGTGATYRWNKELGSSSSLTLRRGILVNSLNDQLFSLIDTNSGTFNQNQANALYLLSPSLTVQDTLLLSTQITLGNYSAIFHGSGFVIIYSAITDQFVKIDLFTGDVENVGSANISYPYAEDFAVYGIASCDSSGGYDLIASTNFSWMYVYNTSTSNGTSLNFGSALGFLESIYPDYHTGRWYFHYEGNSPEFGNGTQRIGYASMEIDPLDLNISWSDGSSNANRNLSAQDINGLSYQVSVAGSSCSDTLSVGLLSSLDPGLPDSIFNCLDTSLTVSMTSYPSAAGYHWSNGDSTLNTTINGLGRLVGFITDTFGCVHRDEVFVKMLEAQIQSSSLASCSGEELALWVDPEGTCAQIEEIFSNNITSTEAYSSIGDDRGGIAVTPDYVYYVGDWATVRFDHDLNLDTTLTIRDYLFYDAGSGDLYMLASSPSSFGMNEIFKLDENLQITDTITLSTNLSSGYSNTILGSGTGFVIVGLRASWNSWNFVYIDLNTGDVSPISSSMIFYPFYSEGGTIPAFAQCTEDGYELILRGNSSYYLTSLSFPSASETVFHNFGIHMGNTDGFAYSRWDGKWFAHHESSSGFASGIEVMISDSVSVPEVKEVLWSTGQTSAQISVNPTTPTTYYVQVGLKGDTCTDSITINVATPSPFNIADTAISCDPTVLVDAGSGFTSYAWSNGDTSQVTETGTDHSLRITVTDTNGCAISDTVYVETIGVTINSASPGICEGDSVELFANGLSRYLCLADFSPSTSGSNISSISSSFDDRSGIAISENYVYATGDYSTVRFTKGSTVETTYSLIDGLFSDIYSGQLYSLWNTGSGSFATTIDALRLYDESLNATSTLELSRSFQISSGNNILFAGAGKVSVHSSYVDSVYMIDLFTGSVEVLGGANLDAYDWSSEGWAAYGVMECDGSGNYDLTYRSGNYGFAVYNSGSGSISTYSISSSTLGDIACFTYDRWQERWYFVYEGWSSTFGGSSENIGYANATGTSEVDGDLEWSTGDSTFSIIVSPDSTTDYTLSFDRLGQTCTDTITITVSNPPSLNLDSLYISCQTPASISLSTHNFYAWSSGDSTQTASFDFSGEAWAAVSDTVGCWAYDTFELSIIPSQILSSDTVSCFDEPIRMWADISGSGPSIQSFSSSGATSAEIYSYIGDDNTGIAITTNYVYVNGDNNVVRLDHDLNYDATLPYTPGLFAEYGQGKIYRFWNSGGSFVSPLNEILALNEDLETIDTITLSESITTYLSFGTRNGVFPGAGYVIFYNDYNSNWYHIDLSDGEVTNLGNTSIYSTLYPSEGWASYGFAQRNSSGYQVYYRTSSGINTFDMSSTSTAAFISNMGDIANIAYNPWNERWYASYEGFTFMGSRTEGVGYATLDDGLDFDFVWSTGDTARLIEVVPDSTTTYTLTVTNGVDSCSNSKTISLPPLQTSIGLSDTILACGPNNSISLPAGFSNGVWNNNFSGSAYTISSSGLQLVSAIDSFGCEVADTTYAIFSDGFIEALDDAFCVSDSIRYVYRDTTADCPNVDALSTTNSGWINVSSTTGDDNCGFAVTEDYVFVNGDYSLAKLSADLTTVVGQSFMTHRYGIFSDLSSGKLYAFGSAPYSYFNANYISEIFEIDENFNYVDTITLSEVITPGSGSGIYSGANSVMLFSNYDDIFYNIDLHTGLVTEFDDHTWQYSPYASEGWANYGILDCGTGGHRLIYRDNSGQTIEAFDLASGTSSTVSSFSNLGDAGMIGFSPWTSQWYGASEFSTQFASTSEHVFRADGSTLAPSLSLTWSNGDTTDTAVYAMDSISNYVNLVVDGFCSSCGTCDYNDTINVDSALNITASALQGNSCPEDTNGIVAVEILGAGLADLVWSTGDTTDTLFNLLKGTYSVTATTIGGCESIDTAVVSGPEGITIQRQINPPSCPGDSDGSILLTVTGPFASYSYSWSTGSTWNGDSNLTAGTYSVTITDSNSCEYYRQYNLPNAFPVYSPNPITVSQNPVCSGDAVTVSAFSGIGSGSGVSVYSQSTPVQFTNANADTLIYQFVGLSPVYSSSAILQLFYRGDLDNAGEYVSYYGEGGYFLGTSDATSGCATFYGTKSINVPSSLLNNWNADDTVTIMAVTTADVNQCNPKYQGYLRFNYIQGSKTYWFTDQCHEDPSLAFDSTSSITFIPDSATTLYAVNRTSGCWSSCDSVTINIQDGADLTTNFDTVNLCDLSSINLKAQGADVIYWQPSTGLNTVIGDSVIAGPSNDRTYTLYGQNLNGCLDTAYIRVNVNESLFLDSLLEIQPLCYGDSGGSLQAWVKGGNEPYTYLWSTGEDSTFISDYPSDNYWLYVEDTIGQCTDTFDLFLDQPDSIVIDFNITDISCFGANDGAVGAVISGGTLPYSFNWNTGATTDSISGLVAGVYTITVTDSNGCSNSATLSISEPLVLNVDLLIDTIRCIGANTGALSPVVSGGTAGYDFTWSEGSTTDTLGNLFAGTYALTVTDARGCTASDTATLADGDSIATTITVLSEVYCVGDSSGLIAVASTTPSPVFTWSTGYVGDTLGGLGVGTYSVTTTNLYGCEHTDSVDIDLINTLLSLSVDSLEPVSCYGLNDGFALIGATGAAGPFTYMWSNGASTPLNSSLAPGTYTVTVSDTTGCSDTMSVSITEPDSISISFDSVTQNTCYGDSTGAIFSSASGGSGGLTYSWNSGQTDDTISALSVGTYVLTVTDNNGCDRSDSVDIVDLSPEITLTSYVIDNACDYDSTGAVYLSVIGGVSPYSYEWGSSTATVDSLTDLTAGTYAFTATDALGCVREDSAIVSTLSFLEAGVNLVAPVICNGDSNAIATVSDSGGLGTITYAWSNGATGNTNDSISSGTYSVTVTDSIGCVVVDDIEIQEPNLITFSLDSLDDPNCNGDSNGYVKIIVQGGEGNINYLWSNGDTSNTISGVPAGTYVMGITDSLGCERDSSVTLVEPAILEVTLDATFDPLCAGDSNGIAISNTVGGTQPYAYYWDGNLGESSDSTLSVGYHTLEVIDSLGCSDTSSFVLGEPDVLTITLDSLSDVSCFNAADGHISLIAEGGVGTLSFNWSNGATSSTISGLDTGTYIVEVTDTNACSITDTFTITQPDSLIATIDSNENTSCYITIETGVLYTSVVGGTGPYSYSWSDGSDSSILADAGFGTYTLTVTDANGCLATAMDSIARDTFPVASLSDQGAFCSTDDSIGLVGGLPTGGSYSGQYVVNDQFVPALSSDGSFVVYYTFTDGNGCADTASSSIQIDSIPDVRLDTFDAACLNIGAVALEQGTPLGGTYFGTGVVGDTFYPSLSDTGTFQVGYFYVTEGGCRDTAYSDILVSVYPELSYSERFSLCGNALPVFLNEGFPSGGYHFGPGVSNDLFNPASVSTSEVVIGYGYDHICGVDTAYDTIRILDYPTLDMDVETELCINESKVVEANSQHTSYVWNDTLASEELRISGSQLGLGEELMKLRVANDSGCADSSFITVSVLDTQRIDLIDTIVCLDEELYLRGPEEPGLSYTWSNGDVSPEILAYQGDLLRPERLSLNLEVLNGNGCYSNDSIHVDIIDCDTIRPAGFYNVYPNPAFEAFTVELFLAYDQEVTAIAYDAAGKILDRRSEMLRKGKNWIDYSTQPFGAGVIILQFTLDDRVIATRVVIL